jgi:hypothetical protein
MAAMGIIIALALLLAIFAGSAQADETTPGGANAARRVEGAAAICLALMGGTTMLAGIVWMGMLRRIS